MRLKKKSHQDCDRIGCCMILYDVLRLIYVTGTGSLGLFSVKKCRSKWDLKF